MPERRRKPLKLVTAPASDNALEAPPILIASPQMIGYICGHCGVVLLHAEEGRVHGLLIRCSNCGAYNSTEQQKI
jgi:predicted RNA-binding Zn-ribbon protein involved in translation (DUF1610 family)